MKNNKSNKFSYCLQILLALSALSACRDHESQDEKDGSSILQSIFRKDGSSIAKSVFSLADSELTQTSNGIGNPVNIAYTEKIPVNLVSKLKWDFVSYPDGQSKPEFTINDNGSAIFTPQKSGIYKLIVTDGNVSRKINVRVANKIPFDTSKVQSNNPSGSWEIFGGSVTNQFIFEIGSISTVEIDNIISKYKNLKNLGSSLDGYIIIEIDDPSNSDSLEQLEELKLQKGFNFISIRTIGQKEKSLYIPDDGSGFTDAGDNWHLESIHATDAWDISRGSSDVMIGVLDNGLFTGHEELKGKVYENLSSMLGQSHGTASTGTIVGIANNRKGITGINHNSKVVFNAIDQNGVTTEDNMFSLQQILDSSEKVKVINNSWTTQKGWSFEGKAVSCGNGKYTPTFLSSYKDTRLIRSLSIKNYDRALFVWSAGNDCTDAIEQNGSIHMAGTVGTGKNYPIARLNNTIVVAAYHKNGMLAKYSNYGETVDIASPTEFKAPKDWVFVDSTYYDESDNLYGVSGGFSGTSAAAPVVTGVASLIYSLNQNFTPSEVKDIIISSAKEAGNFVYYRDGDPQPLKYPIPMLNAEAALKEAKKRIESSSVRVSTSITDPTTGKIQLVLTSGNNEFISAYGNIKAGAAPCGVEKVNFSQDFIFGTRNTLDIPLSSEGVGCYLISGKAKFKSKNGTILESSFNFIEKAITAEFIVKDQTTLNPIYDAEVSFSCPESNCTESSVKTDQYGKVKLHFSLGQYKIFSKKSGFKQSSQIVDIDTPSYTVDNKTQSINLFMTADSSKKIGALFGIVRDSDGNLIKNATIRISGGNQTNGFFASATTNDSGSYSISNISKTDSNGTKIPYFTLFVSSTGFKPETKNIVIVLDGKNRREDFILNAGADTSVSTLYQTGFEANISWQLSGQWNNLNQGNTIFNTLVDGGFVTITPDEGNQKAYLPLAKEGNTALWFGQSNTGSFIGQQYSFDSQVSGGTSKQAYSGQATSPLISLVGKQNPELTFWTWWEIESINPNENGFDLMDVQVSIDNGATFTTIKRLNPKIDPNDSGRESKGFSSGGFNRKPVWAQETINLSSYSGSQVRIRFNFDTRDSRYNGFRGWMVDDMKVTALNL